MATETNKVLYRIMSRTATYFWAQGKMITISNYTFDAKEDLYFHKTLDDIWNTLELILHRGTGKITLVKYDAKTRKEIK